MVTLPRQEQDKFAFTLEVIQHFFAHLPQRFKHRPAPTHAELAKTLEEVRLPAGITLIQYVDIEWGQ